MILYLYLLPNDHKSSYHPSPRIFSILCHFLFLQVFRVILHPPSTATCHLLWDLSQAWGSPRPPSVTGTQLYLSLHPDGHRGPTWLGRTLTPHAQEMPNV